MSPDQATTPETARSGDGAGCLEAHACLLGQRARRGQRVPNNGLGRDVDPAEEVVSLAVDHAQDAAPGLAHVYHVVCAHHDSLLQDPLRMRMPWHQAFLVVKDALLQGMCSTPKWGRWRYLLRCDKGQRQRL